MNGWHCKKKRKKQHCEREVRQQLHRRGTKTIEKTLRKCGSVFVAYATPSLLGERYDCGYWITVVAYEIQGIIPSTISWRFKPLGFMLLAPALPCGVLPKKIWTYRYKWVWVIGFSCEIFLKCMFLLNSFSVVDIITYICDMLVYQMW